jgi:transposase-like protein
MKRCTHCGISNYIKHCTQHGYQRYKCKGCNRCFSDKIRKFTFADKERCIQLILNNTGIRKAAIILNCSPSQVLRWIKEFALKLQTGLRDTADSLDTNQLPDVIEMDEIYTRVKKGAIEFQYGFLILGGDVKLLRLSSEQTADVP